MEVLIGFGISMLTMGINKFISPKWGATGIHIFMFVVALIFVVCGAVADVYPSVMMYLITAGKILGAAITLYEVLLKRVSVPSLASGE